VVLRNDKGLGPGDETAYRALVDALRQDKRDVAMLQDFITTPPLRQVMTSQDQKAWILPVGLDGALASPSGKEAYKNVADIVEKSTEGVPFTVNVTGPAVTVADLNATGEHDRIRIELAITILLFIILVIIYRNLLTMLLPLITIGISVVVAQAVVASLGLLGLGIANLAPSPNFNYDHDNWLTNITGNNAFDDAKTHSAWGMNGIPGVNWNWEPDGGWHAEALKDG